jgi:inositol-phosphate transport system permease protein
MAVKIATHRGGASARWRQRRDLIILLGPATLLLAALYFVPVLVAIVISFTDMGSTLAVSGFTTENFERMATRDTRVFAALGMTLIYVACTLGLFNVTFGLILALTTTAVPERAGNAFRAIWLLPRMSPPVVYALLWAWTADPTRFGMINQMLAAIGAEPVDLKNDWPVLVIVIANGFIGASLGMVILTSAIRSIPAHLFHAARVDGAGEIAIARHIVLPAIRWPLSFITVYQTLSLLVSFEYIWLITNGGPFYDTTVYALYVYKRAFENGQYAYGAALSLVLVAIGITAALTLWRFMDMGRLLQPPRIEAR